MAGIWIGASVVVVLAVVLGSVWGSRALSAWRLNAAAEAYVKREAARTRQANLLKR